MAELTKKFHILKNGTNQQAKLYTTVAEAGSSYTPIKVDGSTVYIPLGATSDSRATFGRLKVSKGTEYAILSSGKPPYAESFYGSRGTYTWTCPAGVTRVRVAVVGGGCGGACYYYRRTSASATCYDIGTSINGGISSFNGISASGGSITVTGEHACTVNPGTPNGRAGVFNHKGTINQSGGSPGAGFSRAFSIASGNYGAGGGADVGDNSSGYVLLGSSGGFNTGYVAVTPHATYNVIVGAGGSGRKLWDHANYANNGTDGFVLIGYGGDI